MAAAKKCDRCCKYYDKNEKHTVPENGYKYILGGIATTIIRTNNMFKQYDLCDECLDDLFDFLCGAKVDKDW